MRASRSSWLVAVVMMLAFSACRGELHTEPGNMEVQVALEESGLDLLGFAEVGELPNPPVGANAVSFRFEPADGTGAVDGSVQDSRVLRSEFDRAGQPDPRIVLSSTGIFDVRVPNKAGRLMLQDADGASLGQVDVDPDAPRTKSQLLMRDDDVLSAPVKLIDHGDSSRKVDILFLPEGYTERELDQFHAHVHSIVAQLSAHSGYSDHWNGFNIWRQDVRSRTSGTGSSGRPLDTAFETAAGVSGLERCVFFATPRGQQAARRLGQAAGADATVVLVNSTSHGGCAGDGVVVSARPRWVADVVGHELAHSLFGLADEYETPRTNGSCNVGPNVSSSATRTPWSDMINTSSLPTSPDAGFGTIGAFEGGGYCARGRYRPTHNCMMRTLGAGMCPVCRREVERTMAALAPDDSGQALELVDVTNETGSDLWVACNGAVRSTCSDWTYLTDGETKEIRSPGRQLVLHNADLSPPVVFDSRRVVANSRAVSIYANLNDPLVPNGANVGSNPSTPSGTALNAPRDLEPDGFRFETDSVELSWSPVTGADKYRLSIEVQDGGLWRLIIDHETTETMVPARLGGSGDFRWRVVACDAEDCSASLYARLQVAVPAQGGGTSGGGTPDTAPDNGFPNTPSGLSPSHESSVRVGTVSLRWSNDPDASVYNLTMRRWNEATASWIEALDENDISGAGLNVDFSVADTWFAWSVQACGTSGCSNWSEYSLLLTTP